MGMAQSFLRGSGVVPAGACFTLPLRTVRSRYAAGSTCSNEPGQPGTPRTDGAIAVRSTSASGRTKRRIIRVQVRGSTPRRSATWPLWPRVFSSAVTRGPGHGVQLRRPSGSRSKLLAPVGPGDVAHGVSRGNSSSPDPPHRSTRRCSRSPAFDDVGRLAHRPWPIICSRARSAWWVKRRGPSLLSAVCRCEKARPEKGCPHGLAQRRDLDRRDPEPMIQVLAECALPRASSGSIVATSTRTSTSTRGHYQPGGPALFQHPQELGLHVQGHVPDFVEGQRASRGFEERPAAGDLRPVKAPLAWPNNSLSRRPSAAPHGSPAQGMAAPRAWSCGHAPPVPCPCHFRPESRRFCW